MKEKGGRGKRQSETASRSQRRRNQREHWKRRPEQTIPSPGHTDQSGFRRSGLVLRPEALLFPSVPRSVERDDKELKLRRTPPPQNASGEQQQKAELKLTR